MDRFDKFNMDHQGIFIVDDKDEIVLANDTAKEMSHSLGLALEEFLKALINGEIKRSGISFFIEPFTWHEKNYKEYRVTNESNFGDRIPKCFQTVLDCIGSGVFIDDATGNTQFINKRGETLYGIDRNEVIGLNVNELEEEGIFSPSVAKLVFKEKKQKRIMHFNKFGKKIMTVGTPIYACGEIDKVISTSSDITHLSELRYKLEDMTLPYSIENDTREEIELTSQSKPMLDVLELANKIAQVESTVLITGESGVGKGMFAKYIHQKSNRSQMPFVKLNCGAIPETLLESELFGYMGGAFTDAKKTGHQGVFKRAEGGTLFLDEIGEVPYHLQVKLLHAIQDKEILPVGATKNISIDVRIIAATNRDLLDMVDKKLFRKDLYYRLRVVPLYIISLRERKQDIPLLVTYFLNYFNNKYDESKEIDHEVMTIFSNYSWTGNVRELENLIEYLIVTVNGSKISRDDLPREILTTEKENISLSNLNDAVSKLESTMIENAMNKYHTTRKAATVLGISQPTLVRKMKKYGL